MSNPSDSNPMLAALEAQNAQLRQAAERDALRREYIGILRGNDTAKAGRLLEVAKSLDIPVDSIKNDLAIIQAEVKKTQAAPPPPPDLSKMTAEQKIEYALTQEGLPQRQQPPSQPNEALAARFGKDRSSLNSNELITLGLSQRPESRLPQDREL